MRYLAFSDTVGDDKHRPGGWNSCIGGGDDYTEVVAAASTYAMELWKEFDPKLSRFNRVYWHVADLDTGLIIDSGEFAAGAQK